MKLKVIGPQARNSIVDTIVKVNYDVNLAGRFEVDEKLVVYVDEHLIIIRITQNQYTDNGHYEIKGKICAVSQNSGYGVVKYNEYFNGVTSIYIELNEEIIYRDFLIVPSIVDFTDRYVLSKGLLNIDTASFDVENLSSKWDLYMNGGTEGYNDRVLGHEKIKNEVISAILSGKNILFYGPPGTGKTMIANRVSRVFDCQSKIYTANAQWTSDDTVGGYTLSIDAEGRERMEPVNGCITDVVIECNKHIIHKYYNSEHNFVGKWAIIDELNRAKMDFAFGALFTALDKDYSILELHQYKNTAPLKSEIYIPQTFRIIGTMNNYDKNFLFKFSYALSRRFAHIYIGVPDEEEFDNEFVSILDRVRNDIHTKYGVEVDGIEALQTHGGIIKIKEIIRYLRGYGEEDKIRDIGTAQIIDTVKLYAVQKYLMNETDGNDMADIAINSIIIPSLEGTMEEPQLERLISFAAELDRTIKSLENFKRINY